VEGTCGVAGKIKKGNILQSIAKPLSGGYMFIFSQNDRMAAHRRVLRAVAAMQS